MARPVGSTPTKPERNLVELLDWTTSPHDLVETVLVEPNTGSKYSLSDELKPLVVIDVIHDGHWIPAEFLRDHEGREISLDEVRADYIRERDWGASAVAGELARNLGLPDFTRVNVARVLMDFGRFPGSTPRHADHLHRFAINYPFSQLLSYRQKKRVLEDYYDGISELLEAKLAGRLVKVAIHTYDQFNESGTERPAMSILTRSLGYQNESELPAGLFDPLYPDVLAEFTSDRVLRDRISLTLEKSKIPVAHNYPYLLPEGSLEVRYQVWAFFRALKDAFEVERPETREEPCYQMIWEMLFDTNLRSSSSEALRSYLHMYRRPPVGQEVMFAQAEAAYEEVEAFCEGNEQFVQQYRFSRHRTSSIAIEVRKDIVCELGEDGHPTRLRSDNIQHIGNALAEAISTYFKHDHEVDFDRTPGGAERHAPWDEKV